MIILKEGEPRHMAYNTIEYEVKQPGIGILSLNRPRVYNSVGWEDRNQALLIARTLMGKAKMSGRYF